MSEPRKPGRPKDSKSADKVLAQAFGAAVVQFRSSKGISQEAFAAEAGLERSHMGKLERGEHTPNLVAIMKIARALGIDAGTLLTATEAHLANHPSDAPVPAS